MSTRSRTPTKIESIPPPWHPAPYEIADFAAIQALERGAASAEQQKRALFYIVNDLCGTYDTTYFPDSRDSDFAQGKRHVGLQIVKAIRMSLGRLKKVGPGEQD